MAETQYSPRGKMLYPRISEPDTKFNADGEYSTRLILEADAAAPMMKMIDESSRLRLAEEVKKCKNAAQKKKIKLATPSYEAECDEEGEETGRYIFKFKLNARGKSKKTGKTWTNKVIVNDAKGKVIPSATVAKMRIASGSVAKIAFEPYSWLVKGEAGTTMRLQAIKLYELVQWGSSGNPFADDDEDEDEEGFSIDELDLADDDIEEDDQDLDDDEDDEDEDF